MHGWFERQCTRVSFNVRVNDYECVWLCKCVCGVSGSGSMAMSVN
jgi:hypothetical protein